jgi:hypothetical protein
MLFSAMHFHIRSSFHVSLYFSQIGHPLACYSQTNNAAGKHTNEIHFANIFANIRCILGCMNRGWVVSSKSLRTNHFDKLGTFLLVAAVLVVRIFLRWRFESFPRFVEVFGRVGRWFLALIVFVGIAELVRRELEEFRGLP